MRKVQLTTVAEQVGITPQNLSIIKTGKARGIRFGTLEKLCEVLNCQPGDLLVYEKDS
jgi:putative transcriptional regulator